MAYAVTKNIISQHFNSETQNMKELWGKIKSDTYFTVAGGKHQQ